VSWLWIVLFAVSCAILMAGYVYLVEIRSSATPHATREGSADAEAEITRERTAAR
jgi:hypothetical protein